MKRRLGPWPTRDLFAVTVDGVLLLNTTTLDDFDLNAALRQGRVFIGVPIRRAEARLLRKHLREGCSEAAAFISGRRLWRHRKSRRAKSRKRSRSEPARRRT